MLTTEQQNIIVNYFQDKPVKKVTLFGSFSRNEEDEKSDIDLIISMEHSVGLFTLGKYIVDLEEKLNRKVDLGTEKAISDFLYGRIKNDMKILYEKK